MYKQSAYVLALFLGTSSATQVSQGFATGMNGDEDMGEDITMKGDKFHFEQNVQLSAEPAAAATVKADYPPPEKVHTLDPKIAKAHTTFYNAKSLVGVEQDMRSAFYAQYDQQNHLWRTDDTLVATEDSPQIHPYNYNPWVYKFSRDAMGPHSQHIDDDPEDSRPKSKEELANSPEAVAKREKAEAEEKKLKDDKKEMKDGADSKKSAEEEKKADAEALEGALKKADIAEEMEKIEKKEEKKAELLMTETNNKFYNAQDGLWMYNLVQEEPAEEEKKAAEKPAEDKYGDSEKTHNLMPQRYQARANSNMVNGVNVRRTTFYGQQEPNYIQLEGEPERSGQTTQYGDYGPTEKVQNLMPRRYERSANSNYVDGVNVRRTTYYAQLDDDVNTQLGDEGTPTDGVHILEPIAYKNAADTNLPFTRTTFYWNA